MTDLHFTLRETRAALTRPAVLAACAAAALVCIVSGPFGTNDAPLSVRAVYWTVVVALSALVSTPIHIYAHTSARFEGTPRWARSVGASLVFALILSPPLSLVTQALFGPQAPGVLELLLYTAPIAVAVSLVIMTVVGEEPEVEAPSEPGDNRFLRRLKPELGGEIVRLSMQDHYVEAVTSKGAQLVLMRFGDALEELSGAPGWRIHRSHWVAEAGIAAIRRDRGKTLIVTTDGAELPVSRTYLPDLRDAGVLKRFA